MVGERMGALRRAEGACTGGGQHFKWGECVKMWRQCVNVSKSTRWRYLLLFICSCFDET
jgi:hypothetical protein